MAILRSLAPTTQKVKAHSSWVDCEFAIVADSRGEALVHLSTFGSDDRMSHRKSSQSMQVDRVIAEQLVEMLTDVFHLQPSSAAPESDRPKSRQIPAAVASSTAEPDLHPLAEALMDSPRFIDQYTRLGPRLSPRSVALVVSAMLGAGGRIPYERLAEILGSRAARARQSAAVLSQVLNCDGVAVMTLEDRAISLHRPLLVELYELE